MEAEFQLAGYVHTHYKGHDIKVNIEIVTDLELSQDQLYQIQKKASEAAQIIHSIHYNTDPDEIAWAQQVHEKLINCFPTGKYIHVKPIENEYEPTRLDKWLRVLTSNGTMKIGRRNSVINIDWSECYPLVKARVLFPEHEGTKGDYYIHAGSYEYAAECIRKILR